MDDVSILKSRMWITEKCHMQAEKRNRRKEIFFHLTLAFYSFSTILYSLLQSPDQPLKPGHLTSLAVLSLCLTLIIFGFRYGELASQHRACYLQLQRMRLSNKSATDLNEDYISLLASVPNHHPVDWHKVSINNIFSKKQNLKDSSGKPYEINLIDRMRYLGTCALSCILSIALLVPPIITSVLALAFQVN